MNKKVLAIILGVVEKYLAEEKVGLDDLTDEVNFHPMAEAKFTSLLCQLHSLNLIDPEYFEARITDTCNVMSGCNLSEREDYYLFGLGFKWLDRPSNEPYLITSSLCALSFVEATALTDNPAVKNLMEKSLSGIIHWFEHDLVEVGEEFIPSYSPTVRVPIFNPCAHGSATLMKAARLGFLQPESVAPMVSKIFNVVEQYRADGIGWSYSSQRPVSDLTHINYIARMYIEKLGSVVAEELILPIVGQYYCDGVLYERARILGDCPEKGLGRGSLTDSTIRKSGEIWFSVDADNARLWGVGEMLVTVAHFAKFGKHKAYWINMINQIFEKFNNYASQNMSAELTYPRHYLHFAHGLACSLPYVDEGVGIKAIEEYFSG